VVEVASCWSVGSFPCSCSARLNLWARRRVPTVLPTSERPLRIRRISFESAISLPRLEQDRIARELRRDAGSPKTWPDANFGEFGAELIRRAYQDRGYFQAIVDDPTIRKGIDATGGWADIVFEIDAGYQYRLREIHWKNATVFSEAQLSALMPIRQGEIFSRAKIAAGIEALGTLYRSRGYINFTSIPNTQFDEGASEITLDIDLDEGDEYRWGNLSIGGMEEKDREALLRSWEDLRGQPYSPEAFTRFFEKEFRPLRNGVKPADYTRKRTNSADNTVDVILNLRPDSALVTTRHKVQ
jgi:hypothetical protein